MKNHNNLGGRLNTDSKLVATAFTMAHRDPILVLTTDQDISVISERIVGYIYSPSDRDFDIERVIPPYPITIFGCRNKSEREHSYEPLIIPGLIKE